MLDVITHSYQYSKVYSVCHYSVDDNISFSEKRKLSDSADDKVGGHDDESCAAYCWLDKDTEIGNKSIFEYWYAKKFKPNLMRADLFKGKGISVCI